MRAIALAILALSLTACGGSFEEAHDAHIKMGLAAPARDPAHCASLDGERGLYTGVAYVDAALGGASGIVAGALPDSVPSGWRIGFAASAAFFAAQAAAATLVAASNGAQWAKDCSQ